MCLWGLLYLGRTSSQILTSDLSKTCLTISIVQLILGDVGKVIFGICVAFACLTTSVGLTATVGDYYQDLTNGIVKYRFVVVLVSLGCGIISNIGVEAIVTLATPLLVTLYPVTIVLNLLSDYIQSNDAFIGGVFYGLPAANFHISGIMNLIQHLPFSDQGFAWVIPSIVGLSTGIFLNRFKNIFKNKNSSQQSIRI